VSKIVNKSELLKTGICFVPSLVTFQYLMRNQFRFSLTSIYICQAALIVDTHPHGSILLCGHRVPPGTILITVVTVSA
jgi:hypothetical protein